MAVESLALVNHAEPAKRSVAGMPPFVDNVVNCASRASILSDGRKRRRSELLLLHFPYAHTYDGSGCPDAGLNLVTDAIVNVLDKSNGSLRKRWTMKIC